jgi:glycine oxidase
VESADVVIAGAGIIGLSLALELAATGHRVIVLDRTRAMSEASWAAAGMLAANDPENPPQLTQLAQHSLSLYPSYLAKIENLSGKKVPVRTKTTIQASHAGQRFTSAETRNHRRVSPTELRNLVPELNPANRDFLLIEEQSLDPRDFCIALPLAAKAAGVTIFENRPVLSIDAEPNQIITIQTPTEPINAQHFVNCAGAWAAFPALHPRASATLTHGKPAIAPIKGQMVTVRLKGRVPFEQVLRTPDIYLVPRGEALVTIGATVEQAGFDKTVEPAAIGRLLQTAAELWPPIAEADILETWAGLRPATADQLPLLGKSSGNSNHWIATGHYRNGILLAPGTARLLSQVIRKETPDIGLESFNPTRLQLAARVS